MPSLFSRARTASTPKQPSGSFSPANPNTDEFGRVGSPNFASASTSGRKDKSSKDKSRAKNDDSRRQRTFSTPKDSQYKDRDLPVTPADSALPALPDGTFLSLYIPPKNLDDEVHDYGYLSCEKAAILGLEDVKRLVNIVTEELTSRGLATPLLFSAQALDVSASRVRGLVRSFLATCRPNGATTAHTKWLDEARLAGPHDLGMLLRWGLARIIRISSSIEVRGFIEWDVYLKWRREEEALRYSRTHFPNILSLMPPATRSLLTTLMTFFSRLAAYSSSSGLTPSAIASHFGPLIFGLGPPSVSFSQTYPAYLRVTHATEHLILAFIRHQDAETLPGAAPMPSRLKDWIRGYPTMIPDMKDLEKPRRGARMIKISSIRRNVRLYSPDLVLTAAGWAGDGDASCRKEWDRIVPKGLPPKYSDSYRKRLDLPRNFMPSTSNINNTRPVSPLSMTTSEEKGFAITAETAERFRSLTDLKWGEFEELGFGSADTKKLEFDLGEGARKQRTEKRSTMTWNDFSTSGFSRTDSPLSDTLQFSSPITTTITTWPSHADDINRKLKKSQKALPVFGWETTPVAGPEWTVDEGIVSCWADLGLSTGWTERDEGTFREANWALVEFKSIPATRSPLDETSDPRTDTQWFLFEEFVPREYRDQLTNPKKKRNNFFSPKKKEWKPATTLNGKPYTGRPRSPSIKEAEFDAMLSGHGHSVTKVISLTPERSKTLPPPLNASTSTSHSGISGPLYTMSRNEQSTPQRSPIVRGFSSPAPKSSRSLFKLGKRQGMVASEYDPDLEFETRTASESSDGTVEGTGAGKRTHGRRHSKDDAWVDILVADSGRRPGGKVTTPPKGNSDPELAREQIQRALDYSQHFDDTPEPIAPPIGFREEEEPVTPVIRVRPPTKSPFDYNLPPHPAFTKQREDPDQYRDSNYSTNSTDPYGNGGGSDFEPIHSTSHSRQPTHDIEFPRYADEDDRSVEEEQQQSPAPASPDEFYQHANHGSSRERDQSALLEFYQDRNMENGNGNGNGNAKESFEPKPSKLPVWTGNTQPQSTSSSSSSLVPPELDEEVGDPGRASPGRYIHGAPLHNVAEEEEEY